MGHCRYCEKITEKELRGQYGASTPSVSTGLHTRGVIGGDFDHRPAGGDFAAGAE